MTSMATKIPVDELRARKNAEIPIHPDTNEEKALRFLAANPKYGWPPTTIAERTNVSATSIGKTMRRLYDKGLVDTVSGRYFVMPERYAEIQGFLGDIHNLREMAGETHQTPVHQTDSSTKYTRKSNHDSADSEEDIERVIEGVVEDEAI